LTWGGLSMTSCVRPSLLTAKLHAASLGTGKRGEMLRMEPVGVRNGGVGASRDGRHLFQLQALLHCATEVWARICRDSVQQNPCSTVRYFPLDVWCMQDAGHALMTQCHVQPCSAARAKMLRTLAFTWQIRRLVATEDQFTGRRSMSNNQSSRARASQRYDADAAQLRRRVWD